MNNQQEFLASLLSNQLGTQFSQQPYSQSWPVGFQQQSLPAQLPVSLQQQLSQQLSTQLSQQQPQPPPQRTPSLQQQLDQNKVLEQAFLQYIQQIQPQLMPKMFEVFKDHLRQNFCNGPSPGSSSHLGRDPPGIFNNDSTITSVLSNYGGTQPMMAMSQQSNGFISHPMQMPSTQPTSINELLSKSMTAALQTSPVVPRGSAPGHQNMPRLQGGQSLQVQMLPQLLPLASKEESLLTQANLQNLSKAVQKLSKDEIQNLSKIIAEQIFNNQQQNSLEPAPKSSGQGKQPKPAPEPKKADAPVEHVEGLPLKPKPSKPEAKTKPTLLTMATGTLENPVPVAMPPLTAPVQIPIAQPVVEEPKEQEVISLDTGPSKNHSTKCLAANKDHSTLISGEEEIENESDRPQQDESEKEEICTALDESPHLNISSIPRQAPNSVTTSKTLSFLPNCITDMSTATEAKQSQTRRFKRVGLIISYQKYRFPILRKEHPDLEFKELHAKLLEEYRNLTAEQKSELSIITEQLNDKRREEYNKEVEQLKKVEQRPSPPLPQKQTTLQLTASPLGPQSTKPKITHHVSLVEPKPSPPPEVPPKASEETTTGATDDQKDPKTSVDISQSTKRASVHEQAPQQQEKRGWNGYRVYLAIRRQEIKLNLDLDREEYERDKEKKPSAKEPPVFTEKDAKAQAFAEWKALDKQKRRAFILPAPVVEGLKSSGLYGDLDELRKAVLANVQNNSKVQGSEQLAEGTKQVEPADEEEEDLDENSEPCEDDKKGPPSEGRRQELEMVEDLMLEEAGLISDID